VLTIGAFTLPPLWPLKLLCVFALIAAVLAAA
jgi:hypothetical protein